MNVVTKSGTNAYSGTGFFFGRNQNFNARNYFATGSTPRYAQVRDGGSFGGPIVENKTHFFSAFEYNNVDTVTIVALPAANPYAAAFNGQWPSGNRNYMGDAKVDHRFNDRNSMFVRWSYDNQTTRGGCAAIATCVNDYSRSHSIAAEENWIL